MHYLFLFGTMFILGGIPIFGPPIWIFAIFFRYHYHLSLFPVVFLSALGFTLGRVVLAVAMEGIARYLPERYKKNLHHIKNILERKQENTWIVLLIFFLAPFPSAQLFEAAGFVRLPLLPLTVMFFLGRAISLALYLSLVHLTTASVRGIWHSGLASFWAIAGEIIALLSLIVFFRFDWFVKKLTK